MGLMRQIFETMGENISKSKEERKREESFVRDNKGTEAICAFMTNLFEKGNAGYNWVKKNKVGLFPVINKESVSLCYMQLGDGQSFSGMKPKDIEVARYSFREMYDWYGLDENCGYDILNSRTQLNVLEDMIKSDVEKLSHIKFCNGFLVKMFQ
ncbi:MAG: hypothetical protein HDR14_10700 [Lachnospiraceae bacterium]|nr:hypothetical protein [Lachnospiraceae bacterium]